MKAIFNQYNSIKNWLLVFLIGSSFVSVIIVAFVSFSAFRSTLIDEIGNNRVDVLRQIADREKQVKNTAYTLSNLYYGDDRLSEYLHNTDQYSDEEIKGYLDRMTKQYKESFNESFIDFYVVIWDESGFRYCSEKVSQDYLYMKPKSSLWYKEVLSGQGEIIDIANYKDKELGKSNYTVARGIRNPQGEMDAYLMINVNERQMYQMYENLITDANNIYIVDRNGTIVSSNKEKIRGFNFFNMNTLNRIFENKPYTITKISGEDVLFTRYEDKDSGFIVLEDILLERVVEPVQKVRKMIVFIVGIVIVLACTMAIGFAAKITNPINQLCDFMTGVEGDTLGYECKVEGYKEINILSQGLNLMLLRIQLLLENIRQKEQQKRKIELGFLQAQINPHFMHNTLFSIKCMVDMHKNEEASKMLVSFIQLLRSTLSNPDEFVTIRQEFDILKQYVDILRFRYVDCFKVIMQYEDGVAEKKIPKLLIQPLLENAIFHGVEFRKAEGCIIVIAKSRGEEVLITVEDNGVGIAPDVLDKLNTGIQYREKEHIGVVNVRERIQLYFGKDYGMKIESEQWKGTKVILNFPAIE